MITTIRLPCDSGRSATCRAPRTAPRRRRCPPAGPTRRAHARRSRSRRRRRPRSPRRCSSRLSTGGTNPAPMPWMRWGPAGRPTARPSPRARRRRPAASGLQRSRRYSPTPVIVPPVPTPATSTSTRPSSARRSPGPVVRRCASGLAGLENWSGRKTSLAARHRARGRDGLPHPAHRLGDVDARAVEAQQALALAAHALGQRQHEVIALRRAHERQRDARCCRWSPRRSSCAPARSVLRPPQPRSSRRRSGPSRCRPG